MFDLFQLACDKLAQEVALPNQDLRVIVAHANLVDVLRQSLYYVEEDLDEYRRQMIRTTAAAKAAELRPEHLLSMNNDEEALAIEERVNKRVDVHVPGANESESSSEEEADSSSSSEEEDADEKLIEYITQTWSLPRSKSWPTIPITAQDTDQQDLSSLTRKSRSYPELFQRVQATVSSPMREGLSAVDGYSSSLTKES